MSTLMTYARISDAVYDSATPELKAELSGWTGYKSGRASGGGLTDALQAAVIFKGNSFIVAFKGTDPGLIRFWSAIRGYSSTGRRDLAADLMLGTGFNLCAYARAEDFVSSLKLPSGAQVSLCGHSLGGAIAQVVGHRHRIPFVTFNAPGVAIAARSLQEWQQGSDQMGTLRTAGATISTLLHPVQAWRDVASFFNADDGVNFRIAGEPISTIGYHYGRVVSLPNATTGTGLALHAMASVIYCIDHSVWATAEPASVH